MKKTFVMLSAALMLLGAASCGNKNCSAGKGADSDKEEVYTGVMPAADVAGIRYMRFMIRLDAKRYHSYFSIGCLIICYILIECIGGNTFVQPSGQVAMMLLGIICGQGKRLMHKADTAHGAPLENQDNSPHLPEKTLRHKI